jgi:NCS1 family nucleobase:cation symporter-1
LLGPVGGILIADYYLVRRQRLSLEDLYLKKGIYSYTGGFNRSALISLVLGIIPNIPGFLVTTGLVSQGLFPSWLVGLYSYAWFTGFFVAGVCYYLLMRARAARGKVPAKKYKEEVNYVPVD